MSLGFPLFFKALYVTFFKRPFSLRRLFWTTLFGALFWIVWCIVAIGRALDHVFFPGFRTVEIKKPIFIVGTPRSGTSFTQRLMCLDEKQFIFYRLYQTIFPAIIYQRLFDAMAWVDSRCGRVFSRAIRWGERKCFGGWDSKHFMALTNPEEDEGLLVHTLMTESIFMLFPYFEDLWVAGFPDMLAPRERAKFMRYYRSCLQRHLYAQGGQRTLLCKSTSFPGRVESMLEAFPDARVIHLIRHPYETLPSHVSLFHQVWRVHSPEIAKDSPESRSYAQLAVDWYKQMLAQRERLEGHQYIRIPYAEIKHDAMGTIEKIYRYFSLPMSDAYRGRLSEATRGVRDYRSGHDYSLEEFGLSKEWVQQELGEVMDAYCFER